jgi:hypothetical protein
MAPMNVFVAEGNVEIYLSKLHTTLNPIDRDNLLRLLAKEQETMGMSRKHVENGERRVKDGRNRLERQRMVVAGLQPGKGADHPAARRLDTLKMTQELLERHLRLLRRRQEQTKL